MTWESYVAGVIPQAIRLGVRIHQAAVCRYLRGRGATSCALAIERGAIDVEGEIAAFIWGPTEHEIREARERQQDDPEAACWDAENRTWSFPAVGVTSTATNQPTPTRKRTKAQEQT